MKTNKNKNTSKSGKTTKNMKPPITSDELMGERADKDYTQGELTSDDDAIEKDTTDRLKFGFSFDPQQGDLGSENEYKGDLAPEQKHLGNRYDPSMSTGRVDDSESYDPQVRDLHVKDEKDIGMSYGEDNYVRDKNRDDSPERDSRH